MRKFVFTMAILLLATSAMADVKIIVEDDGGMAAIKYECTAGEHVRAFALNITVDEGTIDGISDYLIGESVAPDLGYGIFPASFSQYVVVDGDGEPNWNDPNYSPLADPCDPDTLGGLGTDGITIEMGALYYPADDSSPNAPGDSGTLCKLTLSGSNVTVTENETRGGVVLTDTTAVDANLSLATNVPIGSGECFPSDHPDYDEWVTVGKPECWCYPRQCHGDADGKRQGNIIVGWRYVSTDDLNVLIAAWNVAEPTKGPGIATITGPNGEPGICADFDHAQQGNIIVGWRRVSTDDLNNLIAYWNVAEPTKGLGVPEDCGGTLVPE